MWIFDGHSVIGLKYVAGIRRDVIGTMKKNGYCNDHE